MDKLAHIAGYGKEKSELLQLRKMLHEYKDYEACGIRIPRGLVLYGVPGVGKTMMARSIADKGIGFVELRAADCCDDGASDAIRESFCKVKACKPSILLLDELDKIAGGSDYYFMEKNDDVRKTLLQEIDMLTEDDKVLIVATCNDINCLGDALMRSGRFDRQLRIDIPNEKDRKEILTKYLHKLRIRKDVDAMELVRYTAGYTCAEIECIINEAGILAKEDNADALTVNHIRRTINKMAFATNEGTPFTDKEELTKVAVHEAGHALTAIYLAPDTMLNASIMPQGSAGGYLQTSEREGFITTLDKREAEIVIALAGRVAEREVLGMIGLGAGNDLEKATSMVYDLCVHHGAYGYDYMLGAISKYRELIQSDRERYELGKTIAAKLREFDDRAKDIISKNRNVFDAVVNALIDKKVLTRDELLEIQTQTQNKKGV